MKDFKNRDGLTQWLSLNNIDYSNWGKGKSKTMQNLWSEYVNGETIFQDDPPIRIVQVVQIIISRENKKLIEVAQEFQDGRQRNRSRPPADKIKPGEDIREAAFRCLSEELGLEPEQIDLKEATYRKHVKSSDSPSYPGLTTRYTLHEYEASVTGLPEDAFWRNNKAQGPGDPVQRHLWEWVSAE